MLSALNIALQNTEIEQSSLRQIIFITDGAVGNEAELFRYIDKNLKSSRLFTVGIGSAPNSYFMTEAAILGKGTFTYVNNVNAINTQMQALFNKLKKPVLADLQVNFPDNVEFYPTNIPDLYQGEPLVLSYKSDKPINNLLLSGILRSTPWQQHIAVGDGANQTGLSTLWASRKIAQLERNKHKGHDIESTNNSILNVAMQHHLVSSMTSLVAVDITPTATTISKDGRVKNLRPKGQNHSGTLPQTATPAQFYALLAFVFLVIALFIYLFNKNAKP